MANEETFNLALEALQDPLSPTKRLNAITALLKTIAEEDKQEQRDAARYRWLFNDVDLAAIKDAFDNQKAPPANLHSAVIEQIVGFYSDKASVDMMIDSAIEAAHGIKE